MTIDEYYQILEKEWAKVNKNSLASIKAYNEMKRRLRDEIEEENK